MNSYVSYRQHRHEPRGVLVRPVRRHPALLGLRVAERPPRATCRGDRAAAGQGRGRRFGADFVESRRRQLERFLQQTAEHEERQSRTGPDLPPGRRRGFAECQGRAKVKKNSMSRGRINTGGACRAAARRRLARGQRRLASASMQADPRAPDVRGRNSGERARARREPRKPKRRTCPSTRRHLRSAIEMLRTASSGSVSFAPARRSTRR